MTSLRSGAVDYRAGLDDVAIDALFTTDTVEFEWTSGGPAYLLTQHDRWVGADMFTLVSCYAIAASAGDEGQPGGACSWNVSWEIVDRSSWVTLTALLRPTDVIKAYFRTGKQGGRPGMHLEELFVDLYRPRQSALPLLIESDSRAESDRRVRPLTGPLPGPAALQDLTPWQASAFELASGRDVERVNAVVGRKSMMALPDVLHASGVACDITADPHLENDELYVVDSQWAEVFGHTYVPPCQVLRAGPQAVEVYRTLRADGLAQADAEAAALRL